MVDLSRFDSEIARQLRRFPPPLIDTVDVAESRSATEDYRKQVASRSISSRADVSVCDASVRSLIDDHLIGIRVYRPAAHQNGPGLAYLHGGGFIMGDLDSEDARCRSLAADAGCVVVSADYRLAPEHPFPVPLEDCYSVLRWIAEKADSLSIDLRRLGVGGCSAGGALAAGLTLLSRERNGPVIALQALMYPMLDADMGEKSIRALSSEVWHRNVERMWTYYLNGPRSAAPAYASPARCRDLRGLPPTYVVTAELDPLRDEAITYAQRLLAADVSVELHVLPRAGHVMDLIAPGAEISRRSLQDQARAIARVLGQRSR